MNKAYRHVYKEGIGWVAIAENASCKSSSSKSSVIGGLGARVSSFLGSYLNLKLTLIATILGAVGFVTPVSAYDCYMDYSNLSNIKWVCTENSSAYYGTENQNSKVWGLGTGAEAYGYTVLHKSYQTPGNVMNSSNGMIDAGGTNPAYSGALALGYNAYAMYGGVSIGSGARVQSGASGSQTLSLGVAIGANSWARGGGVAIGSSSYTDGVNAIAFGRQATAVSSGAQAFGSASSAQGEKSTAIGQSATAKGARSIAFGGSTHTQDPYMYTDVYNTSTDGDDSIAMGTNTKTKGKDTIAIGKSNKIGNASTITNSLAIGNSNTINSKDVMVMGSNVNVGTGFDGAVVLGNASGVSVAVDTPSATIGGITYGNFAGSNPEDGHVVSVGVKSATSTINRQIQNVAAGQISSTSTDAINGSQLYSVANILGNQVSSTYFT